ncbi:MAG: oligosaccharide flippase family protein [Acidobacteriota bacterium]
MSAAPVPRAESKPHNVAGILLKNSLSNAGGVIITSLIAALMPPFLVHRLTPSVYGAWVLVLNLGAFVGYLDFGVQTAVSKFVAEHDAKGDHDGCGRCLSTGLVMMGCAALLGMVLTLALAWSVPELFRKMPPALYHDVRLSILFVGFSLSAGLSTSSFSAVFLGLQRYQVPTTITVISRVLYASVLCAAVAAHSSLVVMAASVAAVNVLTSLTQIVAWKQLAGHVRVKLFPVDTQRLGQMVRYCFVLTIWSMCMLVISGIDMTMVGHYAFAEVAYYAVAAAPTTFMLVVIGGLMGPLLPAASALSTQRSPEQMGAILLRTTRYMTILLMLTGLPLLVAGYPALRLWVGSSYAVRGVPLLRVLLLANIVRQLCGPYSTMVIATAQQRLATVSSLVEGGVNLTCSIWLARHYGAIGVADGTLIGAFAGVGTHFVVSMHYTRNLQMSRLKLLLQGIVRPAAMALPSIALAGKWWLSGPPTMTAAVWLSWSIATFLVLALVSLTKVDRAELVQTVSGRIRRLTGPDRAAV